MRKTYDVVSDGCVFRFSATALKKSLEGVKRGEGFSFEGAKMISTQMFHVDDLVNPYDENGGTEALDNIIDTVSKKQYLSL